MPQRLLSVAFIACSLLLPVLVTAENPATIEAGRKIFQRHWTFEPPSFPDQGETPLAQFEHQLRSLPGDGLGPMHNATSCESCHAAGGAAGVDRNVMMMTLDPRSDFLSKLAGGAGGARIPATQREEEMARIRQTLLELYPALLSPSGVLSMDVVVHEKSTRPLYDLIRNSIKLHLPARELKNWFDAEERTVEAVAERPVLAGRVGEIDFYLSQRNSPPLFGLGLIDQISTSRLNSIARAQARRSGGQVRGRLGAGKFGWRAQTATLAQFVQGACAGELGLQLSGTPQAADLADENYVSLGVDLNGAEVLTLVAYVRSLPRPIRETKLPPQPAEVREGEKIFADIGCNLCHVKDVYPAMGIYSDLLLHDMGDLLQAPSPAPPAVTWTNLPTMRIPRLAPAANPLAVRSGSRSFFGGSISGYYGSSSVPQAYPLERPQFPRFPRGRVPEVALQADQPAQMSWDLLQRQWRTPPLWGVADSAPYLHDGRAETLDAAILWHAGEASEAAAEYRGLDRQPKTKLLGFLEALRAPSVAPAHSPEPMEQPTFAKATSESSEEVEPETDPLSVFAAGYLR